MAAAGGWFLRPVSEYPPNAGDAGWAMAVGKADGQVRVQGLGWHVWVDAGTGTWREPGDVTGEHCFAGRGNYAWLRLGDGGASIEVARGDGGCPGAMPRSREVFYR